MRARGRARVLGVLCPAPQRFQTRQCGLTVRGSVPAHQGRLWGFLGELCNSRSVHSPNQPKRRLQCFTSRIVAADAKRPSTRDGQQNFLGRGHEEKGGCFGDRQAHGGAAGRVPRGFQLIRQGACRVRAADVDVALGREDSLPARTRRNAACV